MKAIGPQKKNSPRARLFALATLAACVTACGLVPRVSNGDSRTQGTRVGNGGEFDIEQPWTEWALLLRDNLSRLSPEERGGFAPDRFWNAVKRTLLTAERDVHVIQKNGTRAKKDIRLEWKNDVPSLAIDIDWYKQASERSLFGALLHEYGQVMGLEKDTYEASAPVLAAVMRLVGASANPGPEVLVEESTDKWRSGLDWATALRLCERYKEAFEQRYFLVYCTFHEQNWTEYSWGTAVRTETRLLGYETYYSEGRASARALFADAFAYSSSYTQRPVVGFVEIPYQTILSTPRAVYGLRVHGWGRMDAPDKVLLRSDNLDGESAVQATFPTRAAALIVCRTALQTQSARDSLKYYRARCTAEKASGEDEGYVFVIKTKSPFAAGN